MNDLIINFILTVAISIIGFVNKKKSDEQAKELKKVKLQSDTVEKKIYNIFNDIKNQFNITIENDTRKIDTMLKDFANLKAHLNERIGTQVQLDADIKQCLLYISRHEADLGKANQIFKSHNKRINELNTRLDIIMPVKNHSSK